jgi:PmbA protein
MSTATGTGIDLQQLAAEVVRKALAAGASDAEVTIREGDEFSV